MDLETCDQTFKTLKRYNFNEILNNTNLAIEIKDLIEVIEFLKKYDLNFYDHKDDLESKENEEIKDFLEKAKENHYDFFDILFQLIILLLKENEFSTIQGLAPVVEDKIRIGGGSINFEWEIITDLIIKIYENGILESPKNLILWMFIYKVFRPISVYELPFTSHKQNLLIDALVKVPNNPLENFLTIVLKEIRIQHNIEAFLFLFVIITRKADYDHVFLPNWKMDKALVIKILENLVLIRQKFERSDLVKVFHEEENTIDFLNLFAYLIEKILSEFEFANLDILTQAIKEAVLILSVVEKSYVKSHNDVIYIERRFSPLHLFNTFLDSLSKFSNGRISFILRMWIFQHIQHELQNLKEIEAKISISTTTEYLYKTLNNIRDISHWFDEPSDNYKKCATYLMKPCNCQAIEQLLIEQFSAQIIRVSENYLSGKTDLPKLVNTDENAQYIINDVENLKSPLLDIMNKGSMWSINSLRDKMKEISLFTEQLIEIQHLISTFFSCYQDKIELIRFLDRLEAFLLIEHETTALVSCYLFYEVFMSRVSFEFFLKVNNLQNPSCYTKQTKNLISFLGASNTLTADGELKNDKREILKKILGRGNKTYKHFFRPFWRDIGEPDDVLSQTRIIFDIQALGSLLNYIEDQINKLGISIIPKNEIRTVTQLFNNLKKNRIYRNRLFHGNIIEEEKPLIKIREMLNNLIILLEALVINF